MADMSAGRNIYLVGSVPLSSTAEVFETVAREFGTRIKRIPDGEVGSRANWAHFESLFRDNPAFEASDEVFRVHPDAPLRRRYRLVAGQRPEAVEFRGLAHAEEALRSYATFISLRDAGKIARGTRFQVGLVPAHSVIWLFVVDEQQTALDRFYNEALLREIEIITSAIPYEDLAIQFDIASAVFARLERGEATSYGVTRRQMLERFGNIVAQLGDHVPPGVDLLFHFCYGDANHRHVVEPANIGTMVEFANYLTEKLIRPIQLIHMPVPRNRIDDDYFEPLRKYAPTSNTELALGLVHFTDGIEGTRRRMGAASNYVGDYSVATECGFGRRPPETIPELLRIHRLAADYMYPSADGKSR
jgi:hypothetical protein